MHQNTSFELSGGPNNVTSAVYQGTCNLCGLVEEVAKYTGETGSSAYHRCLKHEEEVKKRDPGNAFEKHLALFQPEKGGGGDREGAVETSSGSGFVERDNRGLRD